MCIFHEIDVICNYNVTKNHLQYSGIFDYLRESADCIVFCKVIHAQIVNQSYALIGKEIDIITGVYHITIIM